jgi:hypothetical protein
MHDQDIEQRFHLMQKEIEAAVSGAREANLNLAVAVDCLRLELETIKLFIGRCNPAFSEGYLKLREEAMQVIDPQWRQRKL